MAQQTGIASQTISRFELGKQVPRDMAVVMQLRDAAAAVGLAAEEKLFKEALVESSLPRHVAAERPITIMVYRPHVWRLMQAARIAADFFPDEAHAMETAAPQALALVDEVIQSIDPDQIQRHEDPHFYEDLESELGTLAGRKIWKNLIKKGDK